MTDANKIQMLLGLLKDVAEELDGYSDISDGPYGPVPNGAMRLLERIEQTQRDCAPAPFVRPQVSFPEEHEDETQGHVTGKNGECVGCGCDMWDAPRVCGEGPGVEQ